MCRVLGAKDLPRHQRHIIVRQRIHACNIHDRQYGVTVNVRISQRYAITHLAGKFVDHIEYRNGPKEPLSRYKFPGNTDRIITIHITGQRCEITRA